MTLTVGSLFSGIGGLDLGLERAGMRVIWQSEIDPYATRVLAKHWPGVPNYGDITRIDWGNIVRPDVICGGYPCQPFSTAGHRRGENDPRHLWPYVRDAISHLRPRFAILENVRGHLSLGGLSVLSDLTDIGYNAEWRIISAGSLGAPHRRDRLFIVAYPSSVEGDVGQPDNGPKRGTQERLQKQTRTSGLLVADSEVFRPQSGPNLADRENEIEGCSATGSDSGSRSVGYWWLHEPDVGRVADGVPARVDRLKGLGNAVVPQVAEVIGRLVVAHHEQNPD